MHSYDRKVVWVRGGNMLLSSQTRRGNTCACHSSYPTSLRRLMTWPRSSLASLHPAGWTGSAFATGSRSHGSCLRKGTDPPSEGRWCPATRASSQAGRRHARILPGTPAPCGRAAWPAGRPAPGTSGLHLHTSRTRGKPWSTCSPHADPSDSLMVRKSQYQKMHKFKAAMALVLQMSQFMEF